MEKMQIAKSGIASPYFNTAAYSGNWKFSLALGKLSLCPGAKRLLGMAKATDTGLGNIFGIMQREQVIKLIRAFKQAFASGSYFDTKVKMIISGAQVKWLRITGILYYRRWGTPDQVIGTIEDITQLVDEECLSLAVVGHELRNPLTVMKLNVQLLANMLSGKFDQYSAKLLGNVELHINRMTRLLEEYTPGPVDELRAPKLNFSFFDLDELIDTVILEMRTLYPGYRFCKRCAVSAGVKADKYKIIQVFINYLTNAVKFSAPASQILITTEITGEYIEVSVHDRGVGIPAGQESRIFQKFYRADQKSTRPKNSKGLGLYLVKNIIETHGGSVKAERGVNGGAVFSFSLPVYTKNADAATLSADKSPAWRISAGN